MVDPLLSLAFSMHSSPGVYALLLGSGVSRSAGIPTGWEVVLDLIRKISILIGEDCGTDPEAWYKNKYGKEPTYSGLLEELAKTSSERSKIIEKYFEPMADEREQGQKIPTPAHHAIAQLVKSNQVRVILTTNFDRLMEQALESAGIHPTVIRSPDAVDGACPLVHNSCTLIKLHGDYGDIRIKNTVSELDVFDIRVDGLLDRILDEFGLVICGWSGEWDTALRNAIKRTKSRRFTIYWATKGELNETAKELANFRKAEVLTIQDADTFFKQLAEKIDALSEIDRPHPLSAKVAVSQAKKYLSEPKYKIQLHDILNQEVERILSEMTPNNCSLVEINEKEIQKRFEFIESLSEIAISIMAIGCYWGNKDHYPIWIKAINRLANPPQLHKHSNHNLFSYPAILVLYAGGIAAISDRHYELLYELFSKPKIQIHQPEDITKGLYDALPYQDFKNIFGYENKILPRSDRLFQVLRESMREILPGNKEFERAFDRFEAMQSFWSADTPKAWSIPGAFMYRHHNNEEGSVLTEIIKEHESTGERWSIFKAGFFSGKSERWGHALLRVREMVKEVSKHTW
ncbi:MAG: SIR2 family protein [Planctomycetes bacterium]|nr:SIR2 family protein [Planctomycetota bacterium]